MLQLSRIWPLPEELHTKEKGIQHKSNSAKYIIIKQSAGKRDNVKVRGQNLANTVLTRPREVSVRVNTMADDTEGLYVYGQINRHKVRFLVDTGANVTLLKTDIFNLLEDKNGPKLYSVTSQMTLANGDATTLEGMAHLEITLGQTTVNHLVWIADIEADGIIGYDFLKKYNCAIHAGQGQLIINDKEVITAVVQDEDQTRVRVIIKETTTIPPNSEIITPGRLQRKIKTKIGK